jgi:hypothetical protein
MAALRCSQCGARIQVDGTSSCTCAPIVAGEVKPATFQAFRPRLNTAASPHTEDGTPPSALDRADRPVRHRKDRPGRRRNGVIMGLAAAVTLGTVAFSVDAMSSDHTARGGGRPAVSVSPDPDIVAREALQNPDAPKPEEPPQTGGPSQPASSVMGHGGEDDGEHPGSRPSAPNDDGVSPSPSPSPSGDAAGGSSEGGGSADGGSADGGSADGGGTQGSGGDGDDSDEGGGLLGGLFGGLFGGGDGGNDNGHDKGRGHGHGHDKGHGHHGGGGPH